jgi:hypothetical protein
MAVLACSDHTYGFINLICGDTEWDGCACMLWSYLWVHKFDLWWHRVGWLCLHALIIPMGSQIWFVVTQSGMAVLACSDHTYGLINLICGDTEWDGCACMLWSYLWVHKFDLWWHRVGWLCLHALIIPMGSQIWFVVTQSGMAVLACSDHTYGFINLICGDTEWDGCACMLWSYLWVHKFDLWWHRVGWLCLHALIIPMGWQIWFVVTQSGMAVLACSDHTYGFINLICGDTEWDGCACMLWSYLWVHKFDLWWHQSGMAVLACSDHTYGFINLICGDTEWDGCACMLWSYLWVHKFDLWWHRVGWLCLHALIIPMGW